MKAFLILLAAVLAAIGAGVGVVAATGPSLPHFASALPLPLERAVARTLGVHSVEVAGSGASFAYQAPDRIGPLPGAGRQLGLLAAVVGDASYVYLDPPGTESQAEGGAQVQTVHLPAFAAPSYATRAAFFPLVELEQLPAHVVAHGDRYDYTTTFGYTAVSGGRRVTRLLRAGGVLVVRGGYVVRATWQAQTARGVVLPPGSTPELAAIGLSTSFAYSHFDDAPAVTLPPASDILSCSGPAERLPSGRWRCA